MIEQLPKSYKELNYKLYVAIINKIPSEKPEGLEPWEWSKLIHLATLSILLGKSEAEIEALQAVKVGELITAIAYLDKPIEQAKTAYKVKSLDELTFDEFTTYQRLRLDQWNNLEDILLIFLKGSTKEQIDAMNIYDVMQVFFCLNKSTQKYLTRLKYSTMRTIAKQIIKRILTFWQTKKNSPRPNLKTVGGG